MNKMNQFIDFSFTNLKIIKNQFGYAIAVLLGFFVFLLSSCSGYEAAPASYIVVKDISLETNLFYQGHPTHDIEQFSVYVDDNPIGVFSVGKLIPIISNGNAAANLKFYPLVKMNGGKSNLQEYFLLQEFEKEYTFSSGTIDTIDLLYKYKESVNFAFFEGFENNNIFTEDLDDDSNTFVSVSDVEPISGNHCGVVNLDTAASYIEFTSYLYYELPVDGKKTILELDYRGNIGFVMGIMGRDISGQEASIDFIYIKETEDWNKIYIDITEQLKLSELDLYRIVFKARHRETLENSFIFFDNIKLLYSER